MIKAVLFDLDDTLLDQKGASLAALKAFHQAHCATLGWEAAQARWDAGIRTHFEKYVRGEITFQQQRRCRVRDMLEDPLLPDESVDGFFSTYLSEYERSYALFPEVRRTLDGLAGHPMAVITNGDAHQQHGKLERMGIRACFQAVVVSDEVGLRKPDAKIFELAAGRLGVRPSDSLFVGDNFDADYRGSQGAGMHPVLIERQGKKSPDQVRSIVSLDELPGLIGAYSGPAAGC